MRVSRTEHSLVAQRKTEKRRKLEASQRVNQLVTYGCDMLAPKLLVTIVFQLFFSALTF